MFDKKLFYVVNQELRQMDHIQQPNEERRKSVFQIMDSPHDNEIAHLKSELTLMQRKHDRLAQKEKRLQVCG